MSQKDQPDRKSRWSDIESFLGSSLPALPSGEQLNLLKDTTWVEDYVKQMLEKSIPKMGPLHSSRNKPEVFETHNHVIVRLASTGQNPIVKVRTDLIKIDYIASTQKPQLIRLPCLVVPSTARATCKDGILQIKVRKKRVDKTYREVNVRYI